MIETPACSELNSEKILVEQQDIDGEATETPVLGRLHKTSL